MSREVTSKVFYDIGPDTTALIGVDFQVGFGENSWEPLPHAASAVENFRTASQAWRSAGGAVVHVQMLEEHPERHVWGLGRHYGGSNFFWYLKDPAGNFSEYYSDMDCIIDDQLWTPEDLRQRWPHDVCGGGRGGDAGLLGHLFHLCLSPGIRSWAPAPVKSRASSWSVRRSGRVRR
jgi:hypothetical protein